MVLPKKSIKLPLESQVGFVLAGELVGELVELGISIELEKLVELGLSVALAHSEDISSVDDTIEVCELAVENDESVDESVELTDDKTRAGTSFMSDGMSSCGARFSLRGPLCIPRDNEWT